MKQLSEEIEDAVRLFEERWHTDADERYGYAKHHNSMVERQAIELRDILTSLASLAEEKGKKESDELVKAIHLYNTDAVKALHEAEERGYQEGLIWGRAVGSTEHEEEKMYHLGYYEGLKMGKRVQLNKKNTIAVLADEYKRGAQEMLKNAIACVPEQKLTLAEVAEANKDVGTPLSEYAYHQSKGWIECREQILTALTHLN